MALTTAQQRDLRQRLESRRTELRNYIDEELEAAGHSQLVGQVRDTGDEALAELLAGVDFAVAEIDTRELMDIRTALDRMETGQYGVCVDCGVEIAPARLESQPAACRCLDCQASFEAKAAAPTPRL